MTSKPEASRIRLDRRRLVGFDQTFDRATGELQTANGPALSARIGGKVGGKVP